MEKKHKMQIDRTMFNYDCDLYDSKSCFDYLASFLDIVGRDWRNIAYVTKDNILKKIDQIVNVSDNTNLVTMAESIKIFLTIPHLETIHNSFVGRKEFIDCCLKMSLNNNLQVSSCGICCLESLLHTLPNSKELQIARDIIGLTGIDSASAKNSSAPPAYKPGKSRQFYFKQQKGSNFESSENFDRKVQSPF
ncbi:uncharacterized protein MONOS_18009 [Monocercomonoides exilis]|uniref:uncharacterized protein n=1 Tax=Monocercomonoides exilis TaxID=2049356 RepID=UPI003559D90E|nr:hypothetical protein MONOS_18009 [Monocercomonoides exilis]